MADQNQQDANVTANDELRATLADVYSFVRSREVNRQVASYTLDHYITEEMQRIKGPGRELRDAAGLDAGLGSRPTQLEALKKLQDAFNNNLSSLRSMADRAQDLNLEPPA